MASALFEQRHRGSIQPQTKTRLDALQTEFRVKPEAVLVAWDCLQLATTTTSSSSAASSSSDWPETEESFQLLRRKLGEMVAKDSAKRHTAATATTTNISTAQTKFGDRISPTGLGKRPEPAASSSSSSAPKRPHFVPSMERNAVQPAAGEHFNADQANIDQHSVDATTTVTPSAVAVAAVNEWTDRFLSSSHQQQQQHRYMHAPLTAITEELRHRITQFGHRVLESQQVRNPVPRSSSSTSAAVAASSDSPPSTSTPPPAEAAAAPETSKDAEEEEPYEEFCTAFDKVGCAVQGRNVVVCGWVVCEGENEKLGLGNCMLEGVNGLRVKLEWKELIATSSATPTTQAKFSLFPGQYLVVEGVCTTRTHLQVKRVYEEAASAIVVPRSAPSTTTTTSVWTVAGPYTHSADLHFELLTTLLARVKVEQPHAIVLMGPFVDSNHPLIASGRPMMQIEGESLPVDFVDVLSYMLTLVAAQLAGTRTKVLLVPSTDDATHNVVAFPQPPLELPEEITSAAEPGRFVCLPNPAVFSLGGEGNSKVTVGVANVDTLCDFQAEGSPCHGYGARENVSRLTAHMLTSQSFYPIVPPSPGTLVDLSFTPEMNISSSSALDVLLTPSKLQVFAHEDTTGRGTLCVNPGRAIAMRSKMTVCKLALQRAQNEGETAASRARAEFFTVG